MTESRWRIVDEPPAEASPAPPPSKWTVVDEPPAKKRMSEQDLVDAYLKTIEPGKALSQAAASGGSFGLFNRAGGAYDYLVGDAPSYSEGVDRRVAAEKALAEKYPYAHLTGSIAGGVGTGMGVAKTGFTLAKQGAPLFERMARGAAEGLGYGAVAGAGNTYTGNPMDYLNNAGEGAKLGLAVGSAAPAVVSGAGWLASKASQPFNYLRDSKEVMIDRVTKALMDRKQPVDTRGRPVDRINQLQTDVESAAAAGQPEYSVVDAIGKPAQRQLAVVAKQEGPARDLADDFLAPRNAAAPARRAGEIDRTLGVQGTAEQAERALKLKAQTEAGPVYDEAMNVGPVHNDKIAEGLADPIMRRGIAHGIEIQRINNAMTGKPLRTTDPAITGFDEAGDPIIKGVPNMETLQTAKIGLDHMIEEAQKHGPTKYSASLVGFKNRLLEQIYALNPKYAEANRIYSGPMSIRDAVEEGQAAAKGTRRFADTLDEFRAKDPNVQQGYRIGYANDINAALENGRIPVQLTPRSQKGLVELNEMSLDQGPLKPTPRGIPEPGAGRPPGEAPWRTFMNREDQMAKTTNLALGGPATAENLADMLATQTAGQKAVSSLVRLKPQEAWGHAWEAVKSAGRGETEAQRTAIAKALLLNTQNPEEFAALLKSLRGGVTESERAIGNLGPRATGLTSGVLSGAAPGLTRVYVNRRD